MDLKDKVAVVTGGSLGIGKEIVKALFESGIKNVAILDRNKESGEQYADELTKLYGANRVLFWVADVTDSQSVEDAFQDIVAKFKKIDIVVNNAGIIDEENFKQTIDVNLTGLIRCAIIASKHLSKENGGNGGIILNLASVAGLTDCFPAPVYTASKHGVVGYVKTMGHPYHVKRSGITHIALCPGLTRTTLLRKDNTEGAEQMERFRNLMEAEEQTPDVVARAAIYAIKNGEPGSFWVVEHFQLFEAFIPSRFTYQKLVLNNV